MFIKYFDENYYSKLAARKDTFRKIFELLNNKKAIIVETGTIRIKDNWRGDGQSTILFDKYINMNGGRFISIDNNVKNINISQSCVSNKAEFICGDSVKVLNEISKDDNFPKIDLLYLDSFNLDINNFHPSALHHIKELTSIIPKLKKGTIIVVDDNKRIKEGGKGTYVQDYLENIESKKIFDEYQIGFVL